MLHLPKNMTHDTSSYEYPNDKGEQRATIRHAKKAITKWLIILGIVLPVLLVVSTFVLKPILHEQYLRYLQVSEIAIIGFFSIQALSGISFRLALGHCKHTAQSIRSIIRIAGAIAIIAFIVSYLSQDPIIAASISTITGIVIGFAASNLIGNALAGIYLAITRPFSIGDRVTVFGNTGIIFDIGLLYTKIIMENGDVALSANSSLVTTTVIIRRDSESAVEA
jgi:small conductance mechanosensitive channel